MDRFLVFVWKDSAWVMLWEVQPLFPTFLAWGSAWPPLVSLYLLSNHRRRK